MYSPPDINYASNATPSAAQAAPAPPEVNKKFVNKREAVKDEMQALTIAKAMEWQARIQIGRGAKVQRKIDGEPPMNRQKLKQKALDWKSNVNTGTLNAILNRLYPRLHMHLKTMRYLTAAQLPAFMDGKEVANYLQKTDDFRDVFTKTLRAWRGWDLFSQMLARELVGWGYCYPTIFGTFEWRPTLFRQDQAFVPQGTKCLTQEIPFYTVRQNFEVHELLDRVRDEESAKEAGWDVAETVAEINNAAPIPRTAGTQPVDLRRYEDMVRELVPGESFLEGVNVVQVYRLFYKEYDGQVSERVLSRKTGKEIFYKRNLHRSMKDIVLPFVFNVGNGTVYGSPGLMTIIYDDVQLLEVNVNEAFDATRNSGKIALKCADENAKQDMKLTVLEYYILLTGAEFAGAQVLPASTEPFYKMNEFLENKIEEIAGAMMPNPITDDVEKTAKQAEIENTKQGETQMANTDNYLTQIQMLACMIARKMFDPLTDDSDARAARAKLKDAGLDDVEISYLANSVPPTTAAIFSQAEEQKMLAFLQSRIGNPLYDQTKVEQAISNTIIGPDKTRALMVPQGDQTGVIEAARQQLIEDDSLVNGKPIPVSPKDNHMVHMATVEGQQDPQSGQYNNIITQSLQNGHLPGASQVLTHYMAHASAAAQMKPPPKGFDENAKKHFIKVMSDLITGAEKQLQQAQQQAAIQQSIANPAGVGGPQQNAPHTLPPLGV